MLKNKAFLLTIASLLLIGGSVKAADWTPPQNGSTSFSPPSCPAGVPGCEVPLNVSSNGQTKAGALVVGGLRSLTNVFMGSDVANSTLIQDSNINQTYFTKRSSGPVIIDITPEPAAGQYGSVRFFRTTNTAAYKAVEFMKGDGSTSIDSKIGIGGNNSFFNMSGGNVGIGISTPQAPLNIKKEPMGGLPGWVGQVLIEPVGVNDAGITLKSTRIATQLWSLMAGSGSFTGAGNNNFRIYNGNGAGDAVNITPTNNVGIGVATPASKLDVAGDICWTPPGGTRKCLGNNGGGSGGSGSEFWNDNSDGDIRNTNSGSVNIKGQLKIEGGAPGNNKLLVSNANGLGSWKTPSEVPGLGSLGSTILQTTWGGCTPGLGCFVRLSGDAGPTQSLDIIDGFGTVTMSCPAGYKVVSGGAECDDSWNAVVAVKIAYLKSSRPINSTQWQVQCAKLTGSYTFLVTTKDASAIKNASITCAK